MGTISKRQRSRRRLAAFSFLSNISLDGTHRDTKLGIYQLSLQTDHSKYDVLNRTCNVISSSGNISRREPRFLDDLNPRSAISDERLHQTGTSPRERVHSFMSETKAKFLNQKKKNVYDLKSVTSCSSTESIGVCSRQTSSTLSDSSELKFSKSPKPFRNERIILVSSRKVPFLVFSSLPFHKTVINNPIRPDLKQDSNRRRQTSGGMRPLSAINDEVDPLDLLALLGLSEPEDGQDVSYGCLLYAGGNVMQRKCRTQDIDHLAVPCPHMNRCHSFDPSVSNVIPYTKQPTTPPPFGLDQGFEWNETKYCPYNASLTYTPNLLDDPELVTGKHSTVLTFSSYITSIMDYVKPSDLKKELNEKFRERFPNIHLTLSKLRSLKREMFKITHLECGVDLLTIAQAYVFFEKLILKMLINKHNRKLCAAACILLSAKLNDLKGLDLKNLIEKLECSFRLNHNDLITSEFRVLVALEFSLHLPTWEMFPHYQRLLYES